jgi:hypothetical protein
MRKKILHHLPLARGCHYPKLNAKDMKLFPEALLETVDTGSRLGRLIQFMIQEIRNHQKDCHE